MSKLSDQLAEAFAHGHTMGTAAGSSSDQYTKAETNYRQADSPTESCGDCTHFDGTSKCDIVAGKISESMVCDKFEPKDTAETTSEPATDTTTGTGTGYPIESSG